MSRDDDTRPEGRFIDGQVTVMDENTEAGDDLQRCQRQRIVVVAVTRDRVARSKLGELRYDQRPADVAGVEDYVAPFEREDGLGAQAAMRIGDDADLERRLHGQSGRRSLPPGLKDKLKTTIGADFTALRPIPAGKLRRPL